MVLTLVALLALQEQRSERLIPSEFHGMWDVSQTACDALVSDMRLGISSEEFRIYRDRFRVEKVQQKDEGSLTLTVSFRSHDDFDNEGFGKPYDLQWKLADAGRELTMSRGKGVTTWRRCLDKSG